jgi:hypothetical protein
MEAGEEVDSSAVVACGDVAKMLEFVEEALDAIAQRVGDGVMRNHEFTRRFGGDDRLGVGFGNEIAQHIAIVSFVGDDATGAEIGQKPDYYGKNPPRFRQASTLPSQIHVLRCRDEDLRESKICQVEHGQSQFAAQRALRWSHG